MADDSRRLQHLKHWQGWWRGVDRLDAADEVADAETSPSEFWGLMEAHPDDDGTGTRHHPPDPL